MSLLKNKIGENLRSLRLEHNYTQEYLGEVLGKKDYTAYQRIEYGKSELKVGDAYQLAKLYEIPLEWIIDPEKRYREQYQKKDHLRYSMEEAQSPYNVMKKKSFQITVDLDGSEEKLEDQFELLKGMNQVILNARS